MARRYASQNLENPESGAIGRAGDEAHSLGHEDADTSFPASRRLRSPPHFESGIRKA